MPRYHFHLQDGAIHLDETGMELEDVAAAKCQAVDLAGKMLCDSSGSFWDADQWRMTVSDDTGLTLFTLAMLGTDAPALVGRRPTSFMLDADQQA